MKSTPGPRLRAAALLLLVAGFGFFMGIIVDRLVLGRNPEPRVGLFLRTDGGPPLPPPPRGRRVIRFGPPDELMKELDLSPEQRAELRRILADDQAAIRRVTAQLEPSMRQIIEESRRKIGQVLTEEQMARWDEVFVRHRRRIGEMRGEDGEPE